MTSSAMAVVTLMVLLAMAQGAMAWREGRPRMVVNYMAGEQGEFRSAMMVTRFEVKRKRKLRILQQVERSAHVVHWVIAHHWPLPPS